MKCAPSSLRETETLKRSTFLAVASYLTVSVAWGTTYGGIKLALESFPPMPLAAIRFVLAGGLLMGALRLCGIHLPSRADWVRIAPVGFLLLGCANVLVSWSQQHVDSAFAALLVNSAPLIFVAISAVAGERVPKLAWTGLLVGFAGLFVIIWPDIANTFGTGAEAPPHGPMFWWAVGALVLSPICWASGSFIAKRRKARCHPLMTAAAQSFAGGVIVALVCTLVGGWQFRPITREAVFALGYLMVVGSWLGYVCYIHVVTTLPADIAATTTYLNTIVALVVGALLLGEIITPFMIAGGLVVLAGVTIVNISMARRARSASVAD